MGGEASWCMMFETPADARSLNAMHLRLLRVWRRASLLPGVMVMACHRLVSPPPILLLWDRDRYPADCHQSLRVCFGVWPLQITG
jgi:hypothetical protein